MELDHCHCSKSGNKSTGTHLPWNDPDQKVAIPRLVETLNNPEKDRRDFVRPLTFPIRLMVGADIKLTTQNEKGQFALRAKRTCKLND